mgnify:CR=1 FL=1
MMIFTGLRAKLVNLFHLLQLLLTSDLCGRVVHWQSENTQLWCPTLTGREYKILVAYHEPRHMAAS